MQESQTEVARGRRLGSWHCFCQQTYMGPNMDLAFGRAEAKAAAGVGFRDRRRTRRRRRRRKKGGGTRWPLRMACKTSKLTDSQPGSDMQSRQQEQIAAVGGCHSCPIWQAVKNRRGGKTGGNRYGPWCTARKTRKPETGCSVITQSIGLLSEFSNIAAFQVRNYELRLGPLWALHCEKSKEFLLTTFLLQDL